ncbi:hypothetical protein [Aureispira sp. CCB-QB1]|uniref:hypothetical protein n=1 Tax=Aureispira sp. CCB-QB1 TaxID=1313421 RepID=UPI000697467D|nr:hypothetical protein [Aureispira sp. CCB-QB1]
MKHKKEECKDSLVSSISVGNPSPYFKNWICDLHENKVEYLDFLITIQQLLLKDVAEKSYTKEYIKKLEDNLLTIKNVILHA